MQRRVTEFLDRFPEIQLDAVAAGPDRLAMGLRSRSIDVALHPVVALMGLALAATELRCRPTPFQAGALWLRIRLFCQPGPHQNFCEKACTFQSPAPATQDDPSSRA